MGCPKENFEGMRDKLKSDWLEKFFSPKCTGVSTIEECNVITKFLKPKNGKNLKIFIYHQ